MDIVPPFAKPAQVQFTGIVPSVRRYLVSTGVPILVRVTYDVVHIVLASNMRRIGFVDTVGGKVGT